VGADLRIDQPGDNTSGGIADAPQALGYLAAVARFGDCRDCGPRNVRDDTGIGYHVRTSGKVGAGAAARVLVNGAAVLFGVLVRRAAPLLAVGAEFVVPFVMNVNRDNRPVAVSGGGDVAECLRDFVL
jgi:hypothetical protein